MTEALIAVFGALFGGAGLKLLEHLMNRPSQRANIESQFRDELRSEIDGLRTELRRVDESLKYWRDRYYVVMSALSLAKSHLIQSGNADLINSLDLDKENNNEFGQERNQD